jgi:hypothetical protein
MKVDKFENINQQLDYLNANKFSLFMQAQEVDTILDKAVEKGEKLRRGVILKFKCISQVILEPRSGKS